MRRRKSLRLQVAACVNAVRQYPDGFACEYPCDYSEWRADVISPVRGALTAAGTTGVEDLDLYAIVQKVVFVISLLVLTLELVLQDRH